MRLMGCGPRTWHVRIYFIDMENRPKEDIAGFLKQKDAGRLVLVTGPQSKLNVGNAILDELSKSNSRVEVVHATKTRKELTDKILLAKVGEYHARYRRAELIVVSQDHDFRHAAEILNPHWDREITSVDRLPVRTGAKKQRKRSKDEKPKQLKAPKVPKPRPRRDATPSLPASVGADATTYSQIMMRKSKTNRPRTLEGLRSSIGNIRKTGLDSKPGQIVSELLRAKVIRIDGQTVQWLDGKEHR